MNAYRPSQIRNVGLFSHGGAGKTTLCEAILLNAGLTNRMGRVDEGSTVSDYEPEEHKRSISTNLAVLPLEWKEHKINLLDAPGFLDFAGEVRQAMRVVDGAMVLVDAVAGVEVGTDLVWKQLDQLGLPRIVVVSKIDRENADFSRTVDTLRGRYGNKVVAVQCPIGAHDAFEGVVDLVAMKDVPASCTAMADQLREQMIEAVAETDDDLIAKYLDGETLEEAEVRAALHKAVASGQIFPVVTCAGMANRAVDTLLDEIITLLPSPEERGAVKATELPSGKEGELTPTEAGPLVALVFKTTADPFVGRLTYLRVFSGTLRSDTHVWNANKQRDERLGQLFTVRGKTQTPIPQVGPGDIGAVAKLQETGTGDTLCSREHQYRLAPVEFPKPVFSVAVEPKSKADLDKLGSALHRLAEEDPTVMIRRDPDTAETVVSGLGEQHIDVSVERIKRKFGVELNLHVPRVPYRETIQRKTNSEYRHKKQTGGHGQYGHVVLELEPLPRGSGFEFGERVVGGAVPKNFVPAVEKGVREALDGGVLAGFPVVDLKVTLYDGSYHDVDSSEMAFKIASSQAFRKGFEEASPILLEPVMDVAVTVPEEFVGDVMSDMNGKRARVQGMEPDGEMTTVHAQVPLAQMQRYATDLRSITQGRGTYTMEFSHYEEVPAHIAQQVIAEHKKVQASAAH
ncbi:MAG TPA: elongation factor G [Chloroflexota bacterium]|nr:elongation factor G [Chloroflexota bacterium]